MEPGPGKPSRWNTLRAMRASIGSADRLSAKPPTLQHRLIRLEERPWNGGSTTCARGIGNDGVEPGRSDAAR